MANDFQIVGEAILDRSSAIKVGQDAAKIAQQAFRPIQASIDIKSLSTAKGNFNQLTESSRNFSDSLERGLSRITALSAASAALFGIAKAFQSALQSARDLESSLKGINVVLNLPTDKIEEFGNSLFDVARQTKQTFAEVSKSATEFARQGLGSVETLERTRAALILVNLAGIDSVRATETITASLNSFSKENLKAIDVVSKLAAVDARFAVSSADLAEALTRVGSTAQDVGVGFDKLISITTAAQQVTQRGGSVIGNALKTIFQRLQREDTLNALEDLGIQVREVEQGTGRLTGALIPADRVLAQLGERFKTLTQEQKAQTSELVAGVFQGNIFRGILQGLTFEQEAYQASLNASDEAIRRNAALLTTQDAKIKSISTSLQQAGANIAKVGLGDRINEALSGLSTGDGGNFATNLAGQVIKAFAGTGDAVGNEFAKIFIKSFGDVLSGPGVIAIGVIGAKIASTLGKFASEQLKQVSPFSSKDLTTQQQIDSFLTKQLGTAQNILATENNKIVAEQKILSLFQQENVALTEQVALRASVGAILSRGPAKVRNAADGIIDAFGRERSAISQGIGGASSSAKPVLIPNFNGGKAVANTDEFLVKNYAGTGKDAIFNKEMVAQSGLPSNAVKIGQSEVLKRTSAPIGALLRSGKFTEEQLLKFLDIKSLFGGFLPNYAERGVALGSTMRIPLQRGAFPSQIIPQKGQTKRVADQLLNLGLSREEVAQFLSKFRTGRKTAQNFQTGRGKTPFLIQDEIFGKRDLLSLFVTPKDVLPNVQAASGHVPNFALGGALKLTRAGIIQRQLPSGELARPSQEFLQGVQENNFKRSEVESILRAFEKEGRVVTEQRFLEIAKENQKKLEFFKSGGFASGYVPNFASGDTVRALLQSKDKDKVLAIIKRLGNSGQPITEEAILSSFSSSQIPSIRGPTSNINALRGRTSFTDFGLPTAQNIPSLTQSSNTSNALRGRSSFSDFNLPISRGIPSISSVRQQQNAPSILNATIQNTIARTAKSFDKDLTETSRTFSRLADIGNKLGEKLSNQTITQEQFNIASKNVQKALSKEVARIQDESLSRRQIRGTNEFQNLQQSQFVTTAERQRLGGIANTGAGDFKSLAVLNDIRQSTTERVAKQARIDILTSKIESNTGVFKSGLFKGLSTLPDRLLRTAQRLPSFSQETQGKLSARAGIASFALPFALEGIGSTFTSGIQNRVDRARAERGVSSAASGLSTAALIASVAPNPVGLGVAGLVGVGSAVNGLRTGTTETSSDRAQKLQDFVDEIGQQRDAIASARKSIFDFQTALEDTTLSEKQRANFRREALSSVRGINDPFLAGQLRQQVLGKDFGEASNQRIGELVQDALTKQKDLIATNQNNVTNVFEKIGRELSGRTTLGFRRPAEGLSRESVQALNELQRTDILRGKNTEQQLSRANELIANSEKALRTVKNIVPAFEGNFQPTLLQSQQQFNVAAKLADAFEQAFTPEQREANKGQFQQLREVRGNVQEVIKNLTGQIQGGLSGLKTTANELSSINKEAEKFQKALNLTAFSLEKLGEASIRDVRAFGELDIERNRRSIGGQGTLQQGRDLGRGVNEIQFQEFGNNIVSTQEDSQRQQLESARNFGKQFNQQFLQGDTGSSIRKLLKEGDNDFKKLTDSLLNVKNIDQFTLKVNELQIAAKEAGENTLSNSLQQMAQAAKEASQGIKSATRTEIDRTKALQEQAIINNRLNPNKTQLFQGLGQQIGQSKFIGGLSPSSTEDIAQSNKERLSATNNIFDLLKGLGVSVSSDLEDSRRELEQRARLSDIRAARNTLREQDFTGIPDSLNLKGLLRDALDEAEKTVLSGANVVNPAQDAAGNNLLQLSDIVKDLNNGQLSVNISQAVQEGIKLTYDGSTVPVDGQISISFDQTQKQALSDEVVNKVLTAINGRLDGIDAKLKVNQDNLKTLNSKTNTAVPPVAQP